MTDLEDLRAWLKGHKNYRQISDATGYPYDSLCKFAYGTVEEPRLRNLRALVEYRKNIGTAA